MTIDWQNEIVPRVRQILESRRQQGVPTATVRGIFYILVSEGLIENLPQPYKGLSEALVTARRAGLIPYEWITDETRSIVDITGMDTYYTPSAIINAKLKVLADLPDTYKDTLIPKWYKQPKYIEVWVEKNAIVGVMSAILSETSHRVRIVPNGGWSSETYRHDNISRLLHHRLNEGKDTTVLYYGDYDPTGARMVNGFERVAINEDQITEYNLYIYT